LFTRDHDAIDFSPAILRLEETAQNPLASTMVIALCTFLALLVVGAAIGKLDIVAVADGKLVPYDYVKIVQPAESGIVRQILVREGETVVAGQVLMRMDALVADADGKSLAAESTRRRLSLRRIDAELANRPFRAELADTNVMASEVDAQFRSNRAAQASLIAEEQARLAKARQDLAAALQVRAKLVAVLPHYREQEKAYDKLSLEGFAVPLMASDKRRERTEKEEELKTQEHVIAGAQASIRESEQRLVQIDADYRRRLHAEKQEVQARLDQLEQELAKQAHRQSLLELKAAQDGIVKDLATHTAGTVVQPGTVLLTLVPKDQLLKVEVWVANDDVGFVRAGQPVKVKIATYPFQKYGLLDGLVEHVGPDAGESAPNGDVSDGGGRKGGRTLSYKALVALKADHIWFQGERLLLTAGMQSNAEILLGQRTVLEYLLSPVQRAFLDAGRER